MIEIGSCAFCETKLSSVEIIGNGRFDCPYSKQLLELISPKVSVESKDLPRRTTTANTATTRKRGMSNRDQQKQRSDLNIPLRHCVKWSDRVNLHAANEQGPVLNLSTIESRWIEQQEDGPEPYTLILYDRKSDSLTTTLLGVMESRSNHEPKVVIVGDTGVGKTSILIQLIRHQFKSVDTTVGASYSPKEISTSKGHVVLRLWDTAGQERFRNLVPMYMRNVSAAIFVIDATNEQSFASRDFWFNLCTSNGCEPYIVINKMDSPPAISVEEVHRWAEDQALKCFNISAKDYDQVARLFEAIAEDLVGGGKAHVLEESASTAVREQKPESQSSTTCC